MSPKVSAMIGGTTSRVLKASTIFVSLRQTSTRDYQHVSHTHTHTHTLFFITTNDFQRRYADFGIHRCVLTPLKGMSARPLVRRKRFRKNRTFSIKIIFSREEWCACEWRVLVNKSMRDGPVKDHNLVIFWQIHKYHMTWRLRRVIFKTQAVSHFLPFLYRSSKLT